MVTFGPGILNLWLALWQLLVLCVTLGIRKYPKKEEAAPTQFVKIPEFLVQSPFCG